MQKYISKPDRKKLAEKLGLKDSQVSFLILISNVRVRLLIKFTKTIRGRKKCELRREGKEGRKDWDGIEWNVPGDDAATLWNIWCHDATCRIEKESLNLT